MIFGIGGKLSGGKTCTMVKFALGRWEEGKKVIANFQLFDPPFNERCLFLSNENFVSFLKANYMDQEALRKMFFNSCLCLDEIGNLVASRGSSGTALNSMILNFFMMAGKLDCDIVFSFQVKESQVDKMLREVCNVYANCYRIGENNSPLIFENRKVDQKIMICVILEFDFDILGVRYSQMVYDPAPYYKMYDTREITLLDRTMYMRGGSRDLRK